MRTHEDQVPTATHTGTLTLERPVLDRVPQAVPDAVDAPARGGRRGPWIGFSVILAAMCLNILDSTILNVAAPSIQRDLALSASALEWTAAAYTLAIAVGLLAGGRLGDAFGRKRMLMVGLAGFVASSMVCSVAWSAETLVGGRVLQGLSAALMIPQTFGLIRDIFGPADIGKAFAAFGPAIGLSTVLGPVVAGGLIELDPFGTDWRSLFLVNVPVGVFAIVVGARVLPASAPAHRGMQLDWFGIALTAVVSFLVVFPLVEGRTLGWPVWLVGVVAAAVPLLVVVGRRQRARIARGQTPLVEMSVLRKRSYVSGVVFTMVFFGGIVGFSLAIGLFLQIGLGLSAMEASLYLAGFAVGAFFGSGVGAWATTAVGRPILHVGLAIMAIGTVVLYVSLKGSDTVGWLQLVPGMVVYGLGMGMIFVPLFSIIMGEIEDHEVGSASGMLESFQQLGASVGVAALATLFFATIDLEDGGPVAAVMGGRHVLAAEHTLLVSLVLISVAFAVGFLLPRKAREM
jgi:EmrB/QacA subfamily drug resistance transporter